MKTKTTDRARLQRAGPSLGVPSAKESDSHEQRLAHVEQILETLVQQAAELHRLAELKHATSAKGARPGQPRAARRRVKKR